MYRMMAVTRFVLSSDNTRRMSAAKASYTSQWHAFMCTAAAPPVPLVQLSVTRRSHHPNDRTRSQQYIALGNRSSASHLRIFPKSSGWNGLRHAFHFYKVSHQACKALRILQIEPVVAPSKRTFSHEEPMSSTRLRPPPESSRSLTRRGSNTGVRCDAIWAASRAERGRPSVFRGGRDCT